MTKEFQQVFGHGPKNGCYDGCTTQTGLVLALALDMEGNVGEGPAATHALLVENIQEEHKTHYTTGIIGAKVCVSKNLFLCVYMIDYFLVLTFHTFTTDVYISLHLI